MTRLGALLSIPCTAFILTACNTTDALIPQVDVGHNTSQSTPVTQGDLDQMAAAADRTPSGPISPVQAYAPQNSLQAQAQALNDGAQYGEPVARQQQPAPAPQPQQTAALPATGGSGSIRFLPIIGAPVQAVTPLSRQLGAEARAKGLTIRPSTDTSADNILKGYLSAFDDGGKVTVVYVWDVLDANGARLHRLQGQETVAARGSDPWAAVNDSVMQKVAARTLDDYQSWKQATRG
ncbi:hypothetical protein G6L28_10100 [Agrobacterium larrymoorei]|uniref:hypothetical protein n=1 Tax=Agrobacterium larrymoorei TaxID=160699 RepID=UPI0015748CEE|nr:hypothetical protein [Agrobacterium larrymoorei]NTJ42945.1 hypothetical protein [Agrobacterium larrymoorei]